MNIQPVQNPTNAPQFKGITVIRTGIKRGSKTDKALKMLFEPPKNKALRPDAVRLSENNNVIIKLDDNSSDILEVSESLKKKETLNTPMYADARELKNQIVASIKLLTGKYDKLPK